MVSDKSNIDVQLDQRHLMLRGDTVSCGIVVDYNYVLTCFLVCSWLQLSKVFRLRSVVAQCFREHYFSHGYVEVQYPSNLVYVHLY